MLLFLYMNNFKIVKLKKLPIVVNIPHSSTFISQDLKKDFLLSSVKLEGFAKNLADLYADELFSGVYKKSGALISKLSRVAVDVERFWKNECEPMSKVGMGALYEKDEQGNIVRIISRKSLSLGQDFYQAYHGALNELTAECLKKFGYCIILDCHTYPDKPRQYDMNKRGKRPEICLGTDIFHTPKSLTNSFKKRFLAKKFSVAENTPFKGTIVPDGYFGKDKKVFSLMIEINRRVYMNERNFVKKNNFKKIVNDLADCVLDATNEFIGGYAKR